MAIIGFIIQIKVWNVIIYSMFEFIILLSPSNLKFILQFKIRLVLIKVVYWLQWIEIIFYL